MRQKWEDRNSCSVLRENIRSTSALQDLLETGRAVRLPLEVGTKNRDLWDILVPRGTKNQESRPAPRITTSGQVQYRKSAIHGLPVTLRMFRVRFDKSDWFWSQSIVFTKPFKTGMSLDRAIGRDTWCWPKGARPLGTIMPLGEIESEPATVAVSRNWTLTSPYL